MGSRSGMIAPEQRPECDVCVRRTVEREAPGDRRVRFKYCGKSPVSVILIYIVNTWPRGGPRTNTNTNTVYRHVFVFVFVFVGPRRLKETLFTDISMVLQG